MKRKLICALFTTVSLYYTISDFMNAKLLLGIFWWFMLVCWFVIDVMCFLEGNENDDL